jgi:predicted metal-binding membrane protein
LYGAAALAFVGSLTATIVFCHTMPDGMEMPGGWTMSMMWMKMSGQTWLEAGGMFLMMWGSMMVAMMLPSAIPMFRATYRSLAMRGIQHAGRSTVLAAFGYFCVWLAFGIPVYVAGTWWSANTMQSEELSNAVPALTGGVLLLAGAYQFSTWKKRALGHCRNPEACAPEQARRGAFDHWLNGIRQGINCGVCCSGQMLVLLAVGAMNPIMMALITGLIALEKIVSRPGLIVQFVGIAAVIAGCAVIVETLV